VSASLSRSTKRIAVLAVALSSALVAAGCTSNDPATTPAASTQQASNAVSDNDAPGKKVVIGFSGPAADHGWLAAVNNSALAEAKKYSDVEFKVAEGTNDASLQISQIETFINDKVDAIVLLPTDVAALTEVATKAMQAGITVVNVDREFSSPFAARTTVLGDNYGMGVSAGTYACKLIKDKGLSNPVIAEIAGIDSLPLTQDRSQGFKDALSECGLDVDNRVAADFTVEGGEEAATNLLQAAPKIDFLWNHDDDQGVGVLAAIDNAEAVPAPPAGRAPATSEYVAGTSVGLGSAEVARRELTLDDLYAVLRVQIDEWTAEADTYAAHGQAEAGDRLRREADVLRGYLPG